MTELTLLVYGEAPHSTPIRACLRSAIGLHGESHASGHANDAIVNEWR